MTNSQVEIKAIQERLRAMRVSQSSSQDSPQSSRSATLMVELFPGSVAQRESSMSPREVQTALPTVKAQGISQQLDQAVAKAVGTTARSRSEAVSSAPSEYSPRRGAEQQLAEFRQQLEAKAQHINQLAAAQEAAMLELKTLAERLERDRKAMESQDVLRSQREEFSPVCEYTTTAVPYVERDESGAFVVTSRAVDLFRAEREAALNANRLRRKTGRPNQGHQDAIAMVGRVGQTVFAQLNQLLRLVNQPKTFESARTARSKRAHSGVVEPMTMQQGVLWFAGAVIARVGIDLMLAAFPQLWLPAIALIVTPAAIAVYRTTVQPKSSIAWGCRLLVIMLGLLVGGRL